MADTTAQSAQPTHHRHEGDAYSVVPGPPHTCVAGVKAEPVYVLTPQERADLIAEAEQRVLAEAADAWSVEGRGVMFNKDGGDLTPAQRVGKWLRDRALTTEGVWWPAC